MNARDWEYIESRLLDPARGASDALARLDRLGQKDAANQLRDAIRGFNDQCRNVRRQLQEERRAER